MKATVVGYSGLSGDEMLKFLDEKFELMKASILDSESNFKCSGKRYYISNNGNDANDGHSPEKAIATIGGMKLKPIEAGDAVLFERGGEFRGKFTAIPGVVYSAYGKGLKPIINGSKRNFADSQFWSPTDVPNVFVLNESVINAGFVAFDHDPADIGKYDKLVSTMMTKGVADFTGYKDMKADLTHYSDIDTNKLYLCSDKGNPGERFKSIEIAEAGNVITGRSNSAIDNLHICFGGSHGVAGIGGSTNSTVRNCVIDWIGGSILKGYKGTNLVRYGNGVEVYGSCDGYHVENNWIYQIYDTPITHQFHKKEVLENPIIQRNIRYIDNLLEYFYWGIEQSNYCINGAIEDLICRGNYMRYGGYGWGCPWRAASAPSLHSCGIPDNVKDCFYKDNIIYISHGRPLMISNDVGNRKYVYENTLIAQYTGRSLGMLYGETYPFDEKALDAVRERLGDKTATLVYLSD